MPTGDAYSFWTPGPIPFGIWICSSNRNHTTYLWRLPNIKRDFTEHDLYSGGPCVTFLAAVGIFEESIWPIPISSLGSLTQKKFGRLLGNVAPKVFGKTAILYAKIVRNWKYFSMNTWGSNGVKICTRVVHNLIKDTNYDSRLNIYKIEY